MPAPKLKPIQEYDNYYYMNNKIYGISKEGLNKEPIILEPEKKENSIVIKDFFKINKKLYFEVITIENTGTTEEPAFEEKTYYYQQKNSSIKDIDISEFPEKPVEERIKKYKSENFEVFTDKSPKKYGDITLSKIDNLYLGKGKSTFKMITGCVETDIGLIFNVSESGFPGRPEGLYIFPYNSQSVSKITEKGVFY